MLPKRLQIRTVKSASLPRGHFSAFCVNAVKRAHRMSPQSEKLPPSAGVQCLKLNEHYFALRSVDNFVCLQLYIKRSNKISQICACC